MAMAVGTLKIPTSMQRGLPVQIPHVYERIKKCVSADPLFKLCFVVNPNKKSVKVKVLVPGFKKAVDDALKSEDLTRFQKRMFGKKVGNALHDIAKGIKIPSVDDIFGEMKKNEKRKKARSDREADRLKRMQSRLLKYLNPKERKRFHKLTGSNFFTKKCGSGRAGRACRRRKARLLRKIAKKVAGRRRRKRRRRRARRRRRRRRRDRRRRRRRRKRHGKRVCKKCVRHLQKFKIFNERYKEWYKKYYQKWYQRHVSGPYYRRVLDGRREQRERMRARVRAYRRRRATNRLLNVDKSYVGRAIRKVRAKLDDVGGGGGTSERRKRRRRKARRRGKRTKPRKRKQKRNGKGAAPPQPQPKGKAAAMMEEGDEYEYYEDYYYDFEVGDWESYLESEEFNDDGLNFVTDEEDLMKFLKRNKEQKVDNAMVEEDDMSDYYEDEDEAEVEVFEEGLMHEYEQDMDE